MSRLVIKLWQADTRPVDSDNNYVSITGRESGLIAWFFALVGIDATTRLRVGIERIEFYSSSLAGTNTTLIPLASVSSTYFGFYKPWKPALAIFILILFVGASISSALIDSRAAGNGIAVLLITLAFASMCAFLYYYLNRILTLGFVEFSGLVHGIKFKRSIIENVDIDEKKAESVCMIVQKLIESRQNWSSRTGTR